MESMTFRETLAGKAEGAIAKTSSPTVYQITVMSPISMDVYSIFLNKNEILKIADFVKEN